MGKKRRMKKKKGTKQAANDPSHSTEEGPSTLPGVCSPEVTTALEGTHTADQNRDAESPDIPPLVINTDASSPPPRPPSSIDVTPSLTEDTSPNTATAEEDQPLLLPSPGLDIPPESSKGGGLPLNQLPSSPPSPDRPSTPSSLNSSSSQVDTSSTKQKRGKKIMPVSGNDGIERWQCPICSEVLNSNHDFTAHIRAHNNAAGKKPNTCMLCDKALSSQSSLDRHMLVHSGERPFKCKVCGMSFTTNGNMHRHTRIHNKEEIRAAQKNTEGVKPSKSKPSSVPLAPKPSSPARESTSSWHRPGVYNPDRPVSLLPKPVSGVHLKQLMASESGILQPSQLPLGTSPYSSYVNMVMQGMLSQMVDQKRSLPLMEEDIPPSKKRREEAQKAPESSLKSPTLDHGVGKGQKNAVADDSKSQENGIVSAFQVVKETSGNQTAQRVICRKPESHHPQPGQDCQQCHKAFLRSFSHSLHLSQHNSAATTSSVSVNHNTQLLDDRETATVSSNGTKSSSKLAVFKCSQCDEECETQEKLESHKLLAHFTDQEAEQFIAETLAAQRSRLEPVEIVRESLPGFQDLDFMDFTAKKFSLAAKAQCEKLPRKSNSKFHNFECDECRCSFPNKSALILHLASHVPQNLTKCMVCDCHFLSSDQLHVHILGHAAEEAFAVSRERDDREEAETPQSMEQIDFLALFGLIPKEELTGCVRNEAMIESLSKEQNNKYFSKVYKVFGNLKVKQPEADLASNSERETEFQMDCSSDIPSTSCQTPFDIPSTDTPHPSVSAPPQLSSLVRSQEGSPTPNGEPSTTAKQGPSPPNEASPSDLNVAESSSLQPGSCIPPDTNPSASDFSGTNGNIGMDQKDHHQCTYCGKEFMNKRALKGHVRTHFGMSPYKCMACNYSSADKSTLTRHMRTHNGHRPFKCRLCTYPFTTKANCERHIRKRHNIEDKEEMERCVVMEMYTTEVAESVDSFQSPDTVCQYCGEDFKFFRAFYQHMKTHSSSQQKPFICTKCSVGFSMRAGAIRHIQKHHLDVSDKDIEKFILHTPSALPAGYDTYFHDLDDDSDNTGAGFDTGSLSPSSTPGVSGQDGSPPMAHSTPVLTPSVRNHSHVTDSPLDFSLKNPELAARLSSMMSQRAASAPAGRGEEEEEPMDLSIRGRKTSSSVSPSTSLSPSPATFTSPVPASLSGKAGSIPIVVPCHLCKKVFSSQEAAQQHLVTTHQVSPSTAFTTLAPSDNNNNTNSSTSLAALLPMSVMSSLQLTPSLTGLLQARGASVPILPTHPAFAATHLQQKIATILAAQRSINPSLLTAATTNSSTTKESGSSTPSTATTPTVSSGNESSCDLASVNKIIESTASQNIQVFLKPQGINSGSDDSEPQSTPWESADEDSDQSLDQLYKQSLNSSILIKTERETKPALLKDVINSNGAEGGEENDAKDSMALLVEAQGENKTDISKSQSPTPKTSSNTHSPNKNKTEGTSAPVKKKRNSYADSPHKMKCPHCPRSFPWVSSLNRHMLTHTGQKPFKCTRCNVTFSTKSNRERHLIRKHGVNMLDPASRQTMDRPYKCHLCVFSSFSTEGNLLKHYKDRHPGSNPPDRYLMRMEGDEDGFNDLDDMDLANMDGWSENGSMDTDDVEAPTLSPVKIAVVENVVASVAKNDTKASPSRSKTSTPTDPTHNSIIDDNEDSNDNEPSLTSDATMPSPSFSGSAERHINPERDNYNVDKITFCWKCGEEYNSRKLLVRHLKEHNIDLPFKCYLCDASFDSRCQCLLHQEKSHPSDWAILKDKNGVGSIEKCAERLDRIVERNCKTGQFMEEVEDGESELHIAAVAAENGGLETKMEMVASDYLQRKVYCSLCSKRFWSLQDLRRHMRSHTGERPFECDKCHKRFTLKHSMMRHRRKHNSSANGGSPTAFSDDEEETQLLESSGKVPASHMGSGHKALRQHLAAAVIMRATNIPTTVTETNNNLLSPQDTEDKEEDEDNAGEDILHNLLGVESETIDQIIEKKGSAASLLGV